MGLITTVFYCTYLSLFLVLFLFLELLLLEDEEGDLGEVSSGFSMDLDYLSNSGLLLLVWEIDFFFFSF